MNTKKKVKTFMDENDKLEEAVIKLQAEVHSLKDILWRVKTQILPNVFMGDYHATRHSNLVKDIRNATQECED